MEKGNRTTLSLDVEDRKLLAEVADANGWSVGEATRRAIHALFAFDAYLKAMAENEGGPIGEVLERVRSEVDPALIVHPKPIRRVELDEGAGIRVGDDLAFFERDGRLLAQRETDGHTEQYEVGGDGRLVLTYSTLAKVAALN